MNTFPRRRWLFPLAPIAAVALFSWIVMLLWNAIIPGLMGWALLTYWKAMGLLVLCKILFSGFPCRRGEGRWPHRHGHMRAWWNSLPEEEREQWMERRREWKAKWQGMSAEERAKAKAAMKERCKAMRDPWHHGDEEERARFMDGLRRRGPGTGEEGRDQAQPNR